MKLNKEQIAAKDDRSRVLFINSLSGFKSANLVGTANGDKKSNLAIVSSVVHLGANPPLLGMVMRPHTVPRGTLENILQTGVYTLNHVHSEMYQQAHQTSARYPDDVSEFDEVGLHEQWEQDFAAPFVQESHIKLGMQFREQHHLDINGTEFIIGEIVNIEVPDELVSSDGFISLERANTVAVSSLDTYHTTLLLGHLSYAKPQSKPTFLERDSHKNISIIDSRKSEGASPACVLVVGASGGIGQAYCHQLMLKYPDIKLIRMARVTHLLDAIDGNIIDIELDITNDKSIADAIQALPDEYTIDWVFIASGWLSDTHTKPEKTYRNLQREHLLRSFDINAIGPALLLKNLFIKIGKKHPIKVGILSARVGSISDNRLGGWHAYRASKAALNMLVKNFAIEFKNTRTPAILVGLQPGTTDTNLSKQFLSSTPEDQIQTPQYTADQMIKVMQVLVKEDSGKLFDFMGLSFEP